MLDFLALKKYIYSCSLNAIMQTCFKKVLLSIAKKQSADRKIACIRIQKVKKWIELISS